jgi:hypothetical protein
MNNLIKDIIAYIFTFIDDIKDQYNVLQVCKNFNNIAISIIQKQENIWCSKVCINNDCNSSITYKGSTNLVILGMNDCSLDHGQINFISKYMASHDKIKSLKLFDICSMFDIFIPPLMNVYLLEISNVDISMARTLSRYALPSIRELNIHSSKLHCIFGKDWLPKLLTKIEVTSCSKLALCPLLSTKSLTIDVIKLDISKLNDLDLDDVFICYGELINKDKFTSFTARRYDVDDDNDFNIEYDCERKTNIITLRQKH